MVAVPWKLATDGRNRTRSVSRSSKAETGDTIPMAVQLPPLLVENSQKPLLPAVAVTAMPLRAPASASVMNGLAKLDTRSPAGELLVTEVSFGLPMFSTGAVFTGVTAI